jgi:hypothetical protein
MTETTTEKRNITKEDIFLEARLRAEGARIEAKNASKPANRFYSAVVLDGCEMVVGLMPNEYSRLEVVIDGADVTISDMGEVLGTGTMEERRSWRDNLLSDGTTTVEAAVPTWNADIASIVLSTSCFHHDKGKTCKYCFYNLAPTGPRMSLEALETAAARSVEAIIVALESGWRGTILFTGGTPHPSQCSRVVDDIERFMTRFRESVDEDVFSQIHFSVALLRPPDDLKELYKWKDIGLNGIEFDSQVVDPVYFKAICPGRDEQSAWDEAQAAAAELFGRGRGATTGIVMGIEPMGGLLEGVEERIKRGAFTQLFNFTPVPGSPLGGFRPPTADWFVEAAEKIVDIYLQYADTFEVDLTEDTRFGYTRKGRSFYLSIVDDEMARRLQEMGKLGPGLPRQDG